MLSERVIHEVNDEEVETSLLASVSYWQLGPFDAEIRFESESDFSAQGDRVLSCRKLEATAGLHSPEIIFLLALMFGI